MMGKDERECVKVPFGEYLKVPDDNYCFWESAASSKKTKGHVVKRQHALNL